MHRSSTQPATCGNSSLTGMPDSPCRANFQGEASRLPVASRINFGFSKGAGWPFSRVTRGLGSKVSMCDGPPGM